MRWMTKSGKLSSFLADVLEAQGMTGESKAAARRGLIRVEAILKQRPTALNVLAAGTATAAFVKEFALAEEWAERAVALEPEDYTVRYNVACAYAVMGKPDACHGAPGARLHLQSPGAAMGATPPAGAQETLASGAAG
jgi:hypothetical protein